MFQCTSKYSVAVMHLFSQIKAVMNMLLDGGMSSQKFFTVYNYNNNGKKKQ